MSSRSAVKPKKHKNKNDAVELELSPLAKSDDNRSIAIELKLATGSQNATSSSHFGLQRDSEDEIYYSASNGESDLDLRNEGIEIDDDIMERASSNSGTKNANNNYEILSEAEAQAEMLKISKETSSVIGYSPSVCKVLLPDYKWNKEMLLESFYENIESKDFLYSKNLIEPENGTKSTGRRREECAICYETKPLVGLQCGHLFCRNCWNGYLNCEIVQNGVFRLRCPQTKCNAVLDEDVVLSLVKEPAVVKGYKRLILSSFIESSLKYKWCPGNGCGRVIKASFMNPRCVYCVCGSMFCFKCSEQWHEPIDCSLLKQWLTKCSDDSETANYLNVHTKECPKCHTVIEKNGGCNHMTCKSTNCRYEFCWTCMGPWGPHGQGWYACNRFEDEEAKKARDSLEKTRTALKRYLHYYHRYANHLNSLKLEKKLTTQIKQKIEMLQRHKVSWAETQFLHKAVEILRACRRTLMYTYAFAFYLEQDNESIIFESNQQDLELATEKLSELLETDVLDLTEGYNVSKLKQLIQDKYHYVEQRRMALIDHCAEGYEKNKWIFNQYKRNTI
ncbi:IBR domain, a half RING-finger domain-containing protein [Ditylenchus destructor]|uniref:RBR-type E3 ubiquitin transferase n=1 Tax=Ditylenchus destructor TaxID=166010 RepID=A0AAD4N7K6_9BILA|nr:IBR domain, a half RING-finger domain-containing protein [Ditylenchus destructor]